MPEVAVAEVKAPPVVEVGDVPTFIKNAETFPYKQDSQKPADEAPATVETPEVAKPKEAKEEPKPGKTSYERRLDKAKRQAAEERTAREGLERRLRELEDKTQPKVIEGEPQANAYSDIEEYAKAKADWKAKHEVEAYKAKQQTEAANAAQSKVLRDWESKVEKASSKYDDFDEVVGDFKPASPWGWAMVEAENAVDIAHYLGKNPDEVERIKSLHPYAQFREIGRLSAKLEAAPAAPKQPSKAPPPITPVSGTAQPEAVIRDGMSYADFVKLRNKQLGRK